MGKATTGLRPLDDFLGGLRVGDNVVWETDGDVGLDPFVSAFVRASRRAAGLAYVSFHVSPAAVLDRLDEVWEADRSLLVDCFTDGLGRSEETFGSFYRSRRARRFRVIRVERPEDPGAVQAALAELELGLGKGTSYVFDSLTGMQELWGAGSALSFFLRSCPRLYDLRTVAYWLLERSAHEASFLSRLAHVTQVLLMVRGTEHGQALKILKAEGRPADVLGRETDFTFQDGRIRLLSRRDGKREQFGETLRTHRIAQGLSQAELARRIGISPSALSQAERGVAGLSGETLTRAWEALGLPFGPATPSAPLPCRIVRRGSRRRFTIAPGLVAEEVATAEAGVHVLTFAPGARGRRPPFNTKRREVAVMVSGLLEIRVGEANESLHAGDAAVFSDEQLRAWHNPGPDEATVLWLVLP